jgi:hypothetical protein
MATQRHIGTTGDAGGFGGYMLPIALLSLILAASIAVLVVIGQPVRAPAPGATAQVPAPAATGPALDDRPPHTRDLPPARGDLVLPFPTMPGRVPEWEDFDPTS